MALGPLAWHVVTASNGGYLIRATVGASAMSSDEKSFESCELL